MHFFHGTILSMRFQLEIEGYQAFPRCVAAFSLLVSSAALAACSSEPPYATAACEDYADVFATRIAECGYDYQDNLDAIYESLGGCDRFGSVRDETELYDVCLPSLQALTCEQIEDPLLKLDASCEAQFVPKARSMERGSARSSDVRLRLKSVDALESCVSDVTEAVETSR